MNFRNLLILLIALFLTSITFSQDDDFFDDGISDKSNVAYVNPLALVHGHFEVTYERFISDKISLEVGGGLQLPYHFGEGYFAWGRKGSYLFSPKGGLGLYATGKYFFGEHTSKEGYFYGLNVRYRKYSDVELNGFGTVEKTTMIDVNFAMGFQLFYTDKLFIQYMAGIGMRSINHEGVDVFDLVSDSPFANVANRLSSPISIKLGYAF